jgi:hypothetical protein
VKKAVNVSEKAVEEIGKLGNGGSRKEVDGCRKH